MSMEERIIIFICTSNVCRSPLAAHFGYQFLQENGFNKTDDTIQYKIISRGITNDYEPPNSPTSPNSITIAKTYYNSLSIPIGAIDITDHRSKLLTKEDIDSAYALIGVSKGHISHIGKEFSIDTSLSGGKFYTLGKDISDPWHSSLDVYLRCAQEMHPLVMNVMNGITKSI